MKSILILLFLVSVVFAQKNTPRPNLDNGGFHDIDVNDPDLLKALNAVKDSFGKKLNSTSTFKVSKVNSARSQIVAGINYEVKLTLTQKTCYYLGVGFNSGPSCTSKDRLCQATIWAKVDATYELTSIDCKWWYAFLPPFCIVLFDCKFVKIKSLYFEFQVKFFFKNVFNANF